MFQIAVSGMELFTPVPDPEFLKVIPTFSLGSLRMHNAHIDIVYLPDIHMGPEHASREKTLPKAQRTRGLIHLIKVTS